jgi:hypothetical protein
MSDNQGHRSVAAVGLCRAAVMAIPVIGSVILASPASRRLSDLLDARVQVGGIWL